MGKAGFHAHHLARHFGLSSAPAAIPAGKVVPLVSDLAHRHVFFLLFYLRLPLEKRTFAVSERIGSKIFLRMKKILEVLSYGPGDIRFKTDFHPPLNPNTLQDVLIGAMHSMSTQLWGGDETSVLAMIRMLAVADLALSVNRPDMVRFLDKQSKVMGQIFKEATQEMVRQGKAVVFPPNVLPSAIKS